MEKIVVEYLEKRKKIDKEIHPLYDELNNALSNNSSKETIDKIKKRISEKEALKDAFIDEFAKVVFDINVEKKPKIYDVTNKKKYKWNDFFGTDFEKISKLKRLILTRVYDKDAGYMFK